MANVGDGWAGCGRGEACGENAWSSGEQRRAAAVSRVEMGEGTTREARGAMGADVGEAHTWTLSSDVA
jgi:hypothetical protein